MITRMPFEVLGLLRLKILRNTFRSPSVSGGKASLGGLGVDVD